MSSDVLPGACVLSKSKRDKSAAGCILKARILRAFRLEPGHLWRATAEATGQDNGQQVNLHVLPEPQHIGPRAVPSTSSINNLIFGLALGSHDS